MRETVERSTCPTCGRPTFRYVTVTGRRSPRDPEITTTWWLHEDDNTFACDHPGDDIEFAGGTF